MSEAESKARSHGAIPEHLREYWVHGAGAAKIGWGGPDDYYHCLAELGKYVSPGQVHGLCGNLHEEATGMSTAEHAKLLKGGKHPGNAGESIASKLGGK
ncbi:MAG: hypothetical protein ACRDQG_18295 [Pseudonocardiaceae bacterium]